MLKRIIAFVCLFCICTVMCITALAEGIAPVLSRELVNLYPGQSYRLTLTESSEGHIFVSDDVRIAMIDSSGIITALNEGKTDVRCIFNNKTELKCRVNVKNGSSPQKVMLDSQSMTLRPGDAARLEAKVAPQSGDQTVSFSSSDVNVASVDADGNINAVKPGTAVITAESASTAISAGCVVTVTYGNAARSGVSELSGILYDASGEKLANTSVGLRAGDYYTCVETDSYGRFIFKNAPTGSAVLTVFGGSSSEGISASIISGGSDAKLSCIVTDNALCVLYGTNDSTAVVLREIKLSEDHIDLQCGGHYDMIYSFVPEKALSSGLVFSSDNTDVADVDSTGRITAMNEGNTIIRVSDSSGSVAASMTVHVERYTIGIFGVTVIVMLVLIAVLIVTVYVHIRGRKKGES